MKIIETRELRGLEKVCRLYGSIKCGSVLMLWDYANEMAVPESVMPLGSKRWKESEKARWTTPATTVAGT